MKAHIVDDVDIKTVELILNHKKYDVACSLNVLKKIKRLPEDMDEADEICKIVTWLINDSIDRKYVLTQEREEKVTEDYVGLFISASNMNYFYGVLSETMNNSLPESEPTKDDEGDEIVVTDEMTEMFGEVPKNTVTE